MREELKDEVFDICYCSPLMRARRTAEIVVDGRVEIVIDDNLKERGFGELEGPTTRTGSLPDLAEC